MFHRRLVLVACVMIATTMILSAQMFRLSVVEGSTRLAKAEQRLDERRYLATYRGRIIDSRGRVLAVDQPSNDIAVPYDIIAGTWELDQARKQARKDLGTEWADASPDERRATVEQRLPRWEQQVESLWAIICRLGGISREELDRRLTTIRQDVQSRAEHVWGRQLIQEQIKYGIDAEQFKRLPIREQREAHTILPRVSDEVAYEFHALEHQFEGMLEVQHSTRREYPWLNAKVNVDRSSLPGPLRSDQPRTVQVVGIADHILGSVRDDVHREDVERRPFVDPKTGRTDLGGYRAFGDVVGDRGLERVFEDHLRGLRGMIVQRRDTGRETRTEFIPGRDLKITLDIALQARIQAILSHEVGLTVVQRWQENPILPEGTPLNSAAVVLDVETGEILAMVSMPTMAMGQVMDEPRRRRDSPWVNRAIEAIYPPGSIIKPLVLAAAVSEGKFGLGSTIECTGHYFPDKDDVARCWIYRDRYGMTNHSAIMGGGLTAEQAMARSCNIFFFTLADRLGMPRLVEWYSRFGLGQVLDAGLCYVEQRPQIDREGRAVLDERGRALLRDVLVGEAGGSLPSEVQIEGVRKRGGLEFETIIMGIGQGPVTWTPLQAANAYAMLARGGTIRDATLVIDDPRSSTRRREQASHPLAAPLVHAALEGLRESVEESFGTGHHITALDREPIINAEGVTVWAKTGTAQAPPLALDEDGDGKAEQIIDDLDHAWFVGLVGPRQLRGQPPQPLFAIAVVVEYGGSGGKVSGPIANQIVHALQNERYLPGKQPGDDAFGGGMP
jgi:penicillin-binding protein 2